MSMKIIRRSEANALGLKRYFDGIACPSGHISEKLVVNYTCIKCLHEKYFSKRRIKRKANVAARELARAKDAGGHHLPYSRKTAKEAGLKRYFTGRPCPNGHIAERYVNGTTCVICAKLRKPKDITKHRATTAKSARKRRAKNGDEERKKIRDRHKSDIQFHLRSIIRCRIKSALRGTVKSKTALFYLGCSVVEAKAHIEKQFTDGMTWDNHSLKGWHIDHIIPLWTFDLTDDEQRKKAFNYTNLQPLWALDNLIKPKRLPKNSAA